MTTKTNLTAITKDLGLRQVGGMLRHFVGSYPRLEVGNPGTVGVLCRLTPSGRARGMFYWTILVNAEKMVEGHGVPGDMGPDITTARLAYEVSHTT